MRCLVTAGSSREMIDRVRSWGNIFTGNTGLRIAEALSSVAEVDLVTSNVDHVAKLAGTSPGASSGHIRAITYTDHASLRTSLASLMRSTRYDAVIMSSAVADYVPGGVFEIVDKVELDGGAQQWTVQPVDAAKVKSHYREIAIRGERAEKLVDLFRTQWQFSGMLIKFKLEVGISREELIQVGQYSRLASGADFLVANTLDMVEGTGAGAYLLGNHVTEWVERDKLAARICRLVVEENLR